MSSGTVSSTSSAKTSAAILAASRDALIAAFNADASGKLAAAASFLALTVDIPDSGRLHRMLTNPTFGDCGRVDMTVNAAGNVLKGGVSTSMHMNPGIADLAHDYMGKLVNVPSGTGCYTVSASAARLSGFKVVFDEILVATDASDAVIIHVLLVPPFFTHKDDVVAMLARVNTTSSDAMLCAYAAAAEPADDDEDDTTLPAFPLHLLSLVATAQLPATASCVSQLGAIPGSLSASVMSSAAKLQVSDEDDSAVINVDRDSVDELPTALYPAVEANDEVHAR